MSDNSKKHTPGPRQDRLPAKAGEIVSFGLVLLVLLGLAWVSAAHLVQDGYDHYSYLHYMVDALYGVLLFIVVLYVARRSWRIRGSWTGITVVSNKVSFSGWLIGGALLIFSVVSISIYYAWSIHVFEAEKNLSRTVDLGAKLISARLNNLATVRADPVELSIAQRLARTGEPVVGPLAKAIDRVAKESSYVLGYMITDFAGRPLHSRMQSFGNNWLPKTVMDVIGSDETRIVPVQYKGNTLVAVVAPPACQQHGLIKIFLIDLVPAINEAKQDIATHGYIVWRVSDTGHVTWIPNVPSPAPRLDEVIELGKGAIAEVLNQFSLNENSLGDRLRISKLPFAGGDSLYLVFGVSNKSLVRELLPLILWQIVAGVLGLLLASMFYWLYRQQKAIQASYHEIEKLSFMRNLSESSPDVVYAKDVNGVFKLLNAAGRELYGVHGDIANGAKNRDLLPADLVELADKADRLVLDKGEVVSTEEIISSSNGDRYFVTTRSPIRDKAGNISGLLAVSKDLTDLHLGWALLEESQEIARLGSWVSNRDTNQVKCTRQTIHVLGLDSELVSQDDFLLNIDSSKKNLIRKALNGEDLSSDFRLLCGVHLSGERRFVEIRSGSAKPNSHIAQGTVQDITDRIHAEAAMQRYASMLDATRSIAMLGDVVIRENGSVSLNSISAGMLGLGMEDLGIDEFLAAFRPNDRQSIRNRIEMAFSGVVSQIEVNIPLVDGPHDLRLMLAEFPSDLHAGSERWALCVIVDITRDQMVTRRLRDLAHKLTLAREDERKRIAYELHDGLGQVLAAIKMRASREGDSNIPSMVDAAMTSVRTILASIRPVSLESGFPAAVRAVVSFFERNFATTVDADIEAMEPPEEMGSQIIMILQELFQNTQKHAKATRVALDITLNNEEDSIEIWYSDNGIGFDLVDIGTSEGLGLLSLSERVRAMLGKHRIETSPGHGTKHFVTLPSPKGNGLLTN